MEFFKQQAINGKFDRELVFGHSRRLNEEPSQNEPLQDDPLQDRQLQVVNAPWKVDGLVVSHIFKYLNLHFTLCVVIFMFILQLLYTTVQCLMRAHLHCQSVTHTAS
jgi:hypothetical protein